MTITTIKKIKHSIYISFVKVVWFLRKNFLIKVYGLGYSASKIDFEFPFLLNGARFQFVPSAAKSFGYLPAGIPNEPETHLFLQYVLNGMDDVLFIDVGASIGEFVITMACDSRVSKVFAFEPHHQSRHALHKSAQYAPLGKIEISGKGISFENGFSNFNFSERAPTAAGILNLESSQQGEIEICTLDNAVQPKSGQPVILLIDIEGGELNALRGGMELIHDANPLIIFEYNATTRKFFLLKDAMELIGKNYSFHRLRSGDGRLDNDLSTTWNVVALPCFGPWARLKNIKDLFVL